MTCESVAEALRQTRIKSQKCSDRKLNVRFASRESVGSTGLESRRKFVRGATSGSRNVLASLVTKCNRKICKFADSLKSSFFWELNLPSRYRDGSLSDALSLSAPLVFISAR